ncbi:class A beta-lactamase [Sphaerisporangium fuscum]|uniref:class A beta-lactamase n=1 Tax=Sphaerisporangium fuscum TaxID=2835868 RepID=UPI001BDD0338|nr:class A beta-lactamase [Sphaerisporangium fuscum]
MRDSQTRGLSPAAKAALTFSLVIGGTAYGAATASADTSRTASAAAVRDGQAVRTTPISEAEVRKQIRRLEASYKGRIGAYALDTATGKTVGHRANEIFAINSTFKAMECAAVLKKARTSEPGLMNKVIHWTQDEVVSASPKTDKRGEEGMTVAELCDAAITYSDNTAGNMVLKQIGGPAGLTKYFRSLKDPISRLDRWETELNNWSPKEKRDTTTPAWIARDLRKVAVDDALAPEDREQLNAWLKANTTGGTRIRAGLPKEWIIGDKTGTGDAYGTADDIAVIRTSATAAPIIMAIYTNRDTIDGQRDNKVVEKTATILAQGLGKL